MGLLRYMFMSQFILVEQINTLCYWLTHQGRDTYIH